MPRRIEDLFGTGIDALVPFHDRLQLHAHRGVGTTPMAISVALSPRLSWQMRVIGGMWHVACGIPDLRVALGALTNIRQLPAQSASFQANPFFNFTGASFIRVIPPTFSQRPEYVRSRNPNRVWHGRTPSEIWRYRFAKSRPVRPAGLETSPRAWTVRPRLGVAA
jgi:hypothetical protein